MKQKIAIQGHPGSFHHDAVEAYFGENIFDLVPAPSFEVLAEILSSGKVNKAMMAIENSIAGTILPNYRILRERNFWIEGEIYRPIHHQLMVHAGSRLTDIREVHSHPMALQQCSFYLRENLPGVKWVETEDTAGSAAQLSADRDPSRAVIASLKAATLYNLEVVGSNIENHAHNYTRFFVISTQKTEVGHANKVSAYFTIPDEKGRLLSVLQHIYGFGMNLSKLQSFPVAGRFRAYFFHIDIEFEQLSDYYLLSKQLKQVTTAYKELGLYGGAHGEIEARIESQIIESLC